LRPFASHTPCNTPHPRRPLSPPTLRSHPRVSPTFAVDVYQRKAAFLHRQVSRIASRCSYQVFAFDQVVASWRSASLGCR
jgi:hypothetical protein